MSDNTSTNTSSAPRRYIYNDDDLQKFLASPCKAELLKLTTAMGQACAASTGHEYDPKHPLQGLSPPMAALHGSLQVLAELVDEIPPQESNHQIRFGNPSFKQWHQRLQEVAPQIVKTILLQQQQESDNVDDFVHVEYTESILQEACEAGRQAASTRHETTTPPNDDTDPTFTDTVTELCSYLQDAFGHPVRLDYGTGHETSFQVFLYALCKRHCFGSTSSEPPTVRRLQAITLSLYHQYLKVTRKLQTIYRLEPAGSHGVWGLDDYYALAFYFGACQLIPTDTVPADIHDRSNDETYLYFTCIHFIKQLKRGVPFYESSPMLNDISQLPTWQKVGSGLIKLYEGEVLQKRQVVQHLTFGTIFCANWVASSPPKEAPTRTLFHAPATKAPWAK